MLKVLNLLQGKINLPLSYKNLLLFLAIPQLAYSSISAECNFNTSEYLAELSQLKEIQKININIIDHKKWTKNLMKATFGKGPIHQKYKKRFNADITTYYSFGQCKHKAKVRLHGDWKDHIDFLEGGKFTQSLDVSLQSGSIANFVKFKLLLPKTRNGSAEIILTHLLRYLDFLAPKNSFVDVYVNGQISPMIIQEKAEKELLESMGAREGPLFEGDESYLFQNFQNFNHYDLINIALSKMTNSDWANSSYESAKISLTAFSILQKTYINFAAQAPENNFALDWGLLSNGNDKLISKWAKYEILLFAAQASHGLIPHNRKFYFNSFYSAFEPVYYDGSPRSLVGEWIRIRPDFKYYPFLREDHFDELINDLSAIDQDHFISLMQEDKILDGKSTAKIFNDLSVKILILKKEFLEYSKRTNIEKITQNIFPDSNSFTIFRKNLKELLPESFILDIINSDNSTGLFQAELCSIKSDSCKKKTLHFSDLGTLLEKKFLDQDNHNLLPRVFIAPSFIENDQDHNYYFFNKNISIESSASTAILFDSKNKVLDISFSNYDDWALIFDSNLMDIELKVSSGSSDNMPFSSNNKRLNSRGLTGCLSIYNSSLDKTKISVIDQNKSCEDTVNIVKSSGNISELRILESISDGLDVDFSNLSIDFLEVQNAGNDCSDFSGGEYIIYTAILLNCGDKGISIGEQSVVSIEDLKIKNSYIGIASKDSSVSSVQSHIFFNVDVCMDVYQKKQEFFGSLLYINKSSCESTKLRQDSNSLILSHEF